jgi:hypothetical protein
MQFEMADAGTVRSWLDPPCQVRGIPMGDSVTLTSSVCGPWCHPPHPLNAFFALQGMGGGSRHAASTPMTRSVD